MNSYIHILPSSLTHLLGNALLSDQQEYLDVGVDRVLTKPVLESSLKAMLEIARQRRLTRGSVSEVSASQ